MILTGQPVVLGPNWKAACSPFHMSSISCAVWRTASPSTSIRFNCFFFSKFFLNIISWFVILRAMDEGEGRRICTYLSSMCRRPWSDKRLFSFSIANNIVETFSSILFFFWVITGDLSTITALIRCQFVCKELHLLNSLELPVKNSENTYLLHLVNLMSMTSRSKGKQLSEAGLKRAPCA